MVESTLSNLAIILLMHLSINTAYHFNQQQKINDSTVKYLHILFVSLGIVAMFYFPTHAGEFRLDLRLVPLVFISFFHGWRYAIPVVIFTSVWRLLLGGEGAVPGTIFGILLPTMLALYFYPLNVLKIEYVRPLIILSVCWLISDLPIVFLLPDGWVIFKTIALFRYGSYLLASYIMYTFMYFGTQHLELMKKLEFFANRDPLTGIFNMRKFEELLSEMKLTTNTTYIAMFDIDHFKAINDIHSHLDGDSVLKQVVCIMQRHLPDCPIGRYGGDEFITLLKADSLDEIEIRLESLRDEIENTHFYSIRGNEISPVTLSIGLGQFQQAAGLQKAIEKADEHLYSAKRSGRNQIQYEGKASLQTN